MSIEADPPQRAFHWRYGDIVRRYFFDGTTDFDCQTGDGQPEVCRRLPERATVPPRYGGLSEVATLVAADDRATASEIDGRTIAGRDARCFRLASAGTPTELNAVLCVWAEKGVTLLLEGDLPNFHGTLVATATSGSVDASAFTLPFVVQE
jgi:hypothetical protein